MNWTIDTVSLETMFRSVGITFAADHPFNNRKNPSIPGLGAKEVPTFMSESFIRGFKSTAKGATLVTAPAISGSGVTAAPLYAPVGPQTREIGDASKRLAADIKAASDPEALARRAGASVSESYGKIMGRLAAAQPAGAAGPAAKIYRVFSGVVDAVKIAFREVKAQQGQTSADPFRRLPHGPLLLALDVGELRQDKSYRLVLDAKMVDGSVDALVQDWKSGADGADSIWRRGGMLIAARYGARGLQLPDGWATGLTEGQRVAVERAYTGKKVRAGGAGPSKPSSNPTTDWAPPTSKVRW